MLIARRRLLVAGAAAAGTLAAGLTPRKLRAEELHDLSEALKPIDPPVPAPDISFVDADGKQHHLSEFRGRGVVVNLWATWCPPCVEEMPSLARLAKTLKPEDIAVLPLSSDRRGAKAVEAFFDKHKITGLPVLIDPHSAAMRAFKARGLPTSIVIDRQGQERARVEGSANWSAPDAVETVQRLASG